MTDDDRFVLDALQSGDPQRLEEMAAVLDALQNGEDELAWRRWLLHAIAAAPLATIEWMLDYGVDLASVDDAGYTPLLAAIESTREDRHVVLTRLIAAGAPLNGRGLNGWTAAQTAAARDDVEALRLLVDAGADLSIRTGVDGYATPLEEAQNRGSVRAVAFLESRAAAPADGSPFPGWRPVVEAGHMPLIQGMLENHGIRSEIVPVGTRGKQPAETLWVKAVDHPRAVELVRQMAAALEAPSSGPWRCAGCGEENDAAFDACWQCGKDHAGG
jgi:hypothetical protein